MSSTSSAGTTDNQQSAHIPTLDGIRAIALLLVFLRHLLPPVDSSGAIESVLWRLQWFGWVGVDVFFVLSGFLITRNLLRDTGKTNTIWVFYAFRIVRIWPVYLLLVSVVVGSAYLLPSSPELEWLHERQAWLWFHQANWLVFLDGPLPFNLTIRGH